MTKRIMSEAMRIPKKNASNRQDIRPVQSFGSWITYSLSKNHVCSTGSFVKFISLSSTPWESGRGRGGNGTIKVLCPKINLKTLWL